MLQIQCRGCLYPPRCSMPWWLYSLRQDISVINRPSMLHIIYHMVNGFLSQNVVPGQQFLYMHMHSQFWQMFFKAAGLTDREALSSFHFL